MAECRTNAENIKIEPCYASWEQQHLLKVKCVADAADSLDGTAFLFSSPTTDFYVWIKTDTGADPAIAGRTAIPVVADTDDSAIEIAALIATAVKANAQFNAAVDECDPSIVYIQCKASGAPKNPAADGAGADATEFTIDIARAGDIYEVGFIDGDITVGLTENLVDVTAHQTGSQIIAALRNGRNIENMAIPMKESDAAKLKKIIEASGWEFTPAGVGATKVSAWGSEDTKSFANILADSRKLVLHPISKPRADKSEDMCFWRAYPILTGVVISGENPRIINVEYKIMPDQLLAKKARQFVFGDHTQNFFAEG